jgi:hypothetical protein
MIAVFVTSWVRPSPILQVAIIADWDTMFPLALMIMMFIPTLQTATRLPSVDPDVAKTPTIVALCKPTLGSVNFELYNHVTEYCQFEGFWSLSLTRQLLFTPNKYS